MDGDGDGDGEEAARCAFLKWGGTYVDFVPLIPREAVESESEGYSGEDTETDQSETREFHYRLQFHWSY